MMAILTYYCMMFSIVGNMLLDVFITSRFSKTFIVNVAHRQSLNPPCFHGTRSLSFSPFVKNVLFVVHLFLKFTPL